MIKKIFDLCVELVAPLLPKITWLLDDAKRP